MLTSEEEAKGLWCFAGRSYCNGTSVNRGDNGGGLSRSRCLGSSCMAWRWQGWKVQGAILPQQNPPEEKRSGPRLGYCGLAGEPSPYGPR